MRDRLLRSATHRLKAFPSLLRLKVLPSWVLISLVSNAILLVALLASLVRHSFSAASSPHPAYPWVAAASTQINQSQMSQPQPSQLGERHQLTYEQWLNQLQQEAQFVAEQPPERLTVLAGDSISLWFPSNLLPANQTWLNQGISGETSSGLAKRLDLFAQTQPHTIFVMIGINDLLRGVEDQTILDNQQQIIRQLEQVHPQAKIVLQSILPHAEVSNWEGRERLLRIPNRRIAALNQRLEEMARQEGVYFLDLYPLFANPDGYLRPELTTDGLHLSPLGYQTWSIALQVYEREVLAFNIAD